MGGQGHADARDVNASEVVPLTRNMFFNKRVFIDAGAFCMGHISSAVMALLWTRFLLNNGATDVWIYVDTGISELKTARCYAAGTPDRTGQQRLLQCISMYLLRGNNAEINQLRDRIHLRAGFGDVDFQLCHDAIQYVEAAVGNSALVVSDDCDFIFRLMLVPRVDLVRLPRARPSLDMPVNRVDFAQMQVAIFGQAQGITWRHVAMYMCLRGCDYFRGLKVGGLGTIVQHVIPKLLETCEEQGRLPCPAMVPKLGDIEGIWTEDDKRELDEGFVAEVATHVIAQEHGQFVLRPWHLQQTTLSQEDFLSSSTIDALRETGEGRPAVVPDQATLGKIVRAECMANEGYPNIMTPSMDDYNLFRVMYWRAVHNENFVLGTVREIDPQVLGRIDELCAQCVYTEHARLSTLDEVAEVCMQHVWRHQEQPYLLTHPVKNKTLDLMDLKYIILDLVMYKDSTTHWVLSRQKGDDWVGNHMERLRNVAKAKGLAWVEYAELTHELEVVACHPNTQEEHVFARRLPVDVAAVAPVGTLARMLKMTYFQHTSSAVQIVNRFLQGNSAVFDVGSVRPWGRGMSWPVEVDINYQLSIVQHVPSHANALRKGERVVWLGDASDPQVRPIALARTFFEETTMPFAALCNFSFANAPMVVTGTFRTMDLQLAKLASVARNNGNMVNLTQFLTVKTGIEDEEGAEEERDEAVNAFRDKRNQQTGNRERVLQLKLLAKQRR